MAQAVKINQAGQVGPRDGIEVSVRNGDDGVLWVTDPGNGPWTITFDKVPVPAPQLGAPGVDRSKYQLEPGCPFAGGNTTAGGVRFFNVPAGGNVPSGNTVGAAVGRTYRYRIRPGFNMPNAAPTHDPDVDVEG
jgi:hypothetical protein